MPEEVKNLSKVILLDGYLLISFLSTQRCFGKFKAVLLTQDVTAGSRVKPCARIKQLSSPLRKKSLRTSTALMLEEVKIQGVMCVVSWEPGFAREPFCEHAVE